VNGQPRAVKGVHLLRHVDKALRAAYKAALPVYKTTPTPVIEYKLEVPNAEAKAEELQYTDSLRMGQLPKNHPLKGRMIVDQRLGHETQLKQAYKYLYLQRELAPLEVAVWLSIIYCQAYY